MTRIELQKSLDKYPENMEVFIPTPLGEFDYEPIEQVSTVNIKFHSGAEGEDPAEIECIVLDEI